MINVLHIMSELSGGGGRMLLNYYSNMDRSVFHFDIVAHGFGKAAFDDAFTAMGSEIIHVTPKKVSAIKNFFEIVKAIRSKKYDIVYAHQNLASAPALLAAWLCGVRVRICHSHSYVKGVDISFITRLMRLLIRIFATDFFACSQVAGRYLFGSRWNSEGNIVLNAFDIDRYRYNPDAEKKLRERFGIGNGTVFVQAGRMAPEKNPIFSLTLFNRIYAKNKNTHLFLIGKGNLDKPLQDAAKSMDCKKTVHFIGETESIYDYYSLGDIFLMPSTDEGFGMTAVEAQVAGEYVLASDAVPIATKITKNIQYLPLDDMDAWEQAALSAAVTRNREVDVPDEFSIHKQAKLFEEKLIARMNLNK